MDKYCRLCLSMTSEHFYEINNSKYRKQLETVIPELNIRSMQAPLLCKKCSVLLIAAYEFKTYSLRADKYLTIFVEINNTDVVPLSEVIKISKKLDEGFNTSTTDDIPFVDIGKIEENNVLCDDQCLVELNPETAPQYLLSDEETVDNKKLKPEVNDPQNKDSETTKSAELKCLECNKKFLFSRQLKQHQFYHTNNHYKCDINDCNESFIMKLDLIKHKKTHTKFQCSVCGNVKQSYRTYQNHLRKHSGLFRCKTCGMDFQNSSELKSHDVVHTGVREFICDLCGKGFGQASTLRTHISSVHATKKPYVCEVCGKAFTQSTLQRQHMITMHLEPDRTHTCSICGKQLRFKSSLWDHMKRHSGERKYACKICDKRFFDSTGLKKHVVIHGNDKPHECPFCFKRTNQKSNLKIHLRTCVKRKEAEQANVSNSLQVYVDNQDNICTVADIEQS